MTKKERVLEYVKRFPQTPNLTLARKIMKDEPELFTTLDACRAMVRLIKGSRGEGLKSRSVAEFVENRENLKNPFKLPESDCDEWKQYKIPNNVSKTLLLSDIHLPYHDVNALTAALKRGKEEGIDSIIINGDLIDFHTISRHEKDPTARSFWSEVEMTREFFDRLRDVFPDQHIYYKIGNHEERWEKYMRVKAPEILDCSDFKLDVILRLAEHKVKYIDNKRIIDYRGLLILHGHEFFGSPSQAVNPARGLWLKTYTSSVIGHLHKTSEHTEQTLDGKIKTTWSLGCLCGLTPEYARINKWNHGFAIVQEDGKGWHMNNYRIYNGKVL